MSDGADTLTRVCAAIEDRRSGDARAMLMESYPFNPPQNAGRRYSAAERMRVFRRDEFIDRYTGKRLTFPGTLRLLSLMYPAEFPYHRNWKLDACHFAFWELCLTVDHLVPLARGGPDEMDNWICTSMISNATKANFTVEELGWQLHLGGDPDQWDGLMGWFLRQYRGDSGLADLPALRAWAAVAQRT